MPRRSSLGPFPKTQRFVEIAACLGLSSCESDLVIEEIRCRLEGLVDDTQALFAVKFFAALPIVSRSSDPRDRRLFGICFREPLAETLRALLPIESATTRAAGKTLERFMAGPRFAQQSIETDEWAIWRDFDGSAFCELGRQFFACLAEEHLLYFLRCHSGQLVDPVAIERHAWELSKITQSFSARWFNKCVADQIPDEGNVRWYLGHCLGKLDMELERGLATHVEPLPNPFRRRKAVEPPSLGLGI